MKVFIHNRPLAVVVARDDSQARILVRLALRQASRRVPRNLVLEEVSTKRAKVVFPKGGEPP